MMKMSGHRLLLPFWIMASSSVAIAQNGKAILQDIQLNTLGINKSSKALYTENPATMFFRDSISLSKINYTERYKHSEYPEMEQLGTGYSLHSIEAESYMRLNSQTVVWGSASFRSGVYRDIRWTDCIDYEYIAPYTLGDEVGGNLNTRQYSFSGGVSRKIRSWSLGLEACYRAEIAYRNRDPRIKTIVSDLDLTVGVSKNITSTYIAGLNAGLKLYSQNCDLEFYNPVNDINTYTLTGMGTFYKRFMGNTNKNSGYNSTGFSLSAQLLTVDKSGFKTCIAIDSYRMQQQLRNFNNITLGFTDNTMLSGSISYRFTPNESIVIEPSVNGMFKHRKGTENLFGSSTGASYDKIGSNTYYTHKNGNYSILIPTQIGGNHTFTTITPYISYISDMERYANPLRKTDVGLLSPGISGEISLRRQSWMWNFAIDGSHTFANDHKPIWTDMDTQSALGKCQLSNYSMLSSERTSGKITVEAYSKAGPTALNIGLHYMVNHYNAHGNIHSAELTVGIHFY